MNKCKKFMIGAAIAAVAFVSGTGFGANYGHDFISRAEVEAMIAVHAAQIDQLTSQTTALTATSQSGYLNSTAEMFRAIDNSVVSINIVQQQHRFNQVLDRHSAGSGVIFHETDDNIYIATNYHVVQGAMSATISLDDIRTAPARFVGAEEQSDLAIISVSRADLEAAGITGYQVAVFGNSDAMEIGNFVLAVGNAYGEGKSATFGIVSARGKSITMDIGITLDVIQTDAAINPGNSGGPLVNTRGEVIGINTARLMTARSEGMGFAIPSNDAVEILNMILERGTIVMPFMGMTTVAVNEEIRAHYDLDATGLFVRDIFRGFAAQSMGLLPGDIITHFNEHRILNHQELSDAINEAGVGGDVRLNVMRNGREIILSGQITGRNLHNTDF